MGSEMCIRDSATMEISRISTDIILESTEEVLPKTEVISQDMSKEEDLEINTGHTVPSVTIEMLLHTEVEAEEELPHTAQVEGTKTTTTTSLKDTEENPVALDIDTVMMAGAIDRALDLTEECQWNIRDKTPDNHQQGVDNLNSEEDLHQEMVERKTSNVGDVEQLATRQTDAKCFPIGEENLVIVVCSTKDETATVPMEHL